MIIKKEELSMDSFKIDIPQNVEKIMDKLEKHGYEAYIVGGCVRDSILNKIPNDWDVTTNATPEEIQCVFDKTIPTGIKHGTVTVMIDNEGYEVTTYRIDGEYSDSRRPDSVIYTKDIKEDLSRRDFTINAMAYNHKAGLIDPFDGLKDINEKIIRCVGRPRDRFKEDPLRMMRAARFSNNLDFYIEPETTIAMMERYESISKVSYERIQMELNKILVCEEGNFKGIHSLKHVGILKIIMPEFDILSGIEQNNPYHKYCVYFHSLYATEYIDNKLHLKLAALLHDLGKSITKTTDENNIDHFYGHEVDSVKLAEDILKRLKYDNGTINQVLTLIKYHSRRLEVTPKAVRRFLNQLGDYDTFKDWASLRWADISSQNPKYFKESARKLSLIEMIAEDIIKQKQPFSVKDLDISGYDLIELGYEGKEIGMVLNELLNTVIETPHFNTKEYLVKIARNYRRKLSEI